MDTLSGHPLYGAPTLRLLDRRSLSDAEYNRWRRSEHHPGWLGQPVLWLEEAVGLSPRHFRKEAYRFESPIPTEWVPNRTLHAFRFVSGSDRALLFIPQKGGGYNFARMLAAVFVRAGFDTFTLIPPLHTSRLPEGVKSFNVFAHETPVVVRHFNQAVTEIRGLLDFIGGFGVYRAVGLFGLSLGALYGSIVAGIDERVHSAVLALGGGDLGGIMAASEMRSVAHRHTVEEYRAAFACIDPLTHANARLGNRVLMFNGLRDRAIPIGNADRLHQQMGCPPRVLYNRGHVSVVTHLPEMVRRMKRHYAETMN